MLINTTFYNTSRTRTLIIIISGVLLLGIILAIYSFTSKENKVVPKMSEIPNNIVVTPGKTSSEKYVELQQNANLSGTKKAEMQGKTFIPTVIGNKSDESKNFNKELSGILKDKEVNNNDYERLSKQLAMLLATLKDQGQEIANLLKLIRELQNQGYDVSDLENLIKKLMADGYNTDDLAKLLAGLKQQGYAINDLENMLKKLLAQGYDPDLINKILEQLLKDRLKNLENAIKALQNSGIDTKNLDNFKQQNPDLTSLLEQLAKQGYKTDSLENLLKQLMAKGYNIFDMQILLQQLNNDGYDVAKLQDLLKQLKDLNKDVSNLKGFLDALKAQHQDQSLDELLAALAKQGADLDKLKKLLAQLKDSGYSEDDLKKLLKDLIAKNYNPDDLYNKLLQKLNESLLKNPKSYLESMFNNPQDKSNNDINKDFLESQKKYEELIKKQNQRLLEEQQNRKLAEIEKAKRQKVSVNAEVRRKELESMMANMNSQADQLTANLTKTPVQAFVKGDELPKDDKVPLGIQDPRKFSQADPGDLNLKAGSILFAVVETAVNSDEPGPILAKIVQGPLKNSTLIGSMQISSKSSEGVGLSFKTINVPDRIRSYSLNAVAIDPDTARTVIATEVDHHYLLRFGAVFAASFIKGYSSSIARAGDSVKQAVDGTTVTTTTTQNTQPTSKQQIFQGLADVATQVGQTISQYSNTPNTITINPGTSIGLLLISDFNLPASDQLPEEQATNNISVSMPQPQQASSNSTTNQATVAANDIIKNDSTGKNKE